MSDINGAIRVALKDYLNESYARLDVADVISWTEVERHDGYCETCYYDYTEVDIVYVNGEGETKTYSWGGTFGELISALDR